MTVGLNSAQGVLQLLHETSPELQLFALEKINTLVDLHWAEIADELPTLELLYEDSKFPNRKLAALVASKVYYHLGEFNDSLEFALKSQDLFDLSEKSEFVDTMIGKAIDKYIELQIEKLTNISLKIDQGLVDVVLRMYERCIDSKKYYQAVGIALETLRLDLLETAISKGDDTAALLNYVLNAAMNFAYDLQFRNQVLKLLVTLYRKLAVPDYLSISQCLLHLNEPSAAAELLNTLSKGNEVDQLMSYQVAFDIEENGTQDFTSKVSNALPVLPAEATVDANEMQVDEGDSLLTKSVPSSNTPLAKLHLILSGKISVSLGLEFLFRNNNTDVQIMRNTKAAFDSRNSALHSSISIANAIQNSGTTNDEFLRESTDWLFRSSNWARFTATAALGVINKGHLTESLKLLGPYLPTEGVSGSPYSEGGALYALGLIHANHGSSVVPTLLKTLRSTHSEQLQHGAALGVGVAAMASGDHDIYETLKTILFTDSAVAGEAAGLAMGLVMLGTGNLAAMEEMLQYAHDTQHEKIIRGLSLGLAMILFGREELADEFIHRLCLDKDPVLRYGGMYAVSMAYSGTGNNKAIEKLLHVAVSDVNDDVRRAAVTGLGFILYKTPEKVPKVVQLLSESYNPYVRYGATMALGIACAGTGLADALDILEPLAKDNVDFVRQGALVGLGMVCMQLNENSCPRTVAVRKRFADVVADKREELLCRIGAALGQGIIDAGGRNVSISLQTRSGNRNISAIIGVAVFTQFWNWFPLAHFISLAFEPTGIIGLNVNLEAPKFQLMSNCKPILYSYPPALKPVKEEVIEKVKAAVLSTTAKSKARAKNANKTDVEMDVDEKKEEQPVTESTEELEAKTLQSKKFEVLENFSRIVKTQEQFITVPPDSRYIPVSRVNHFNQKTVGIVLLRDTKPNDAEEIVVSRLEQKTKEVAAAQAPTAAS